MSIIANAPLWFHLGVGIGVLLLSALSLVATKQLNRPDVGIQLSYVAMIIGVIALAWIIGAAQSKTPKGTNEPVHPHARRYYDHPNDPHFRKLKKKTS